MTVSSAVMSVLSGVVYVSSMASSKVSGVVLNVVSSVVTSVVRGYSLCINLLMGCQT